MAEVRSVIPVEETIIDPLYEPLKLNRYELCPHFKRLKDVSHLRYGFSPYLLFDVVRWVDVVKEIKAEEQLNEEENVFNDLLNKYLELLDKFEDEGIKRNTLIKSLFECRNTIIDVYKAIKMGFDVIQIDDMVKMRNEEKIFEDVNFDYNEFMKLKKAFLSHKKRFFDYIKNTGRYDQILNLDTYNDGKKKQLNTKTESFKKGREGHLKDLKKKTSGIKKKYNIAYSSIINSSRNQKKKKIYKLIQDRFNKITHLYQLDYPVKVKCPKCKGEVAEQYMCEEGKIYSIKEALLRTFELRRARWLYMSGSLHTVHRASTHTRLSHQIGSMIVAVNALYEMDVYPQGDMSVSLGEYLMMKGVLHEFLMANFLHDIGHSPLSHVLEPNPFITLDHEEITRNLIFGERVEEGEGMDWYVAERYLLKTKVIRDFEFRFFENRYDPIYDVGEKWWEEEELRANFLRYLDKNDEILESEIITVSGVLDNFGVDKERVVEILSGKVFRNVNCPNCGKRYKMLLQIEEDTKELKCKICKKAIKEKDIERIEDIEKIYNTPILNKLIDSEIDFDRMDHVKRDSVVCGFSLISFRLLELLGSMSVVFPESYAHKQIHNGESNKPYIFISEDGLLYVMNLLTARRSVFKDILYSDENNWINGVVNQITALAVRYLPHLTNMLPFITDPILAHFYTNDLFLGTQIEKLNKLFHGKMDCSAYGKPMWYKLRDGVIVTKEDLERMYRVIEGINDEQEYEKLELLAVVFYTNIKETKCPRCKRKLKEVMLHKGCGGELEEEKEGKKFGCEKCEKKNIRAKYVTKAIKCEKCKYRDNEGKEKKGEVFYLLDIEESIFKLSKCPICGKKIKERKDFQDFIECEKCGRMRKWNEENWDDIFIYEKKFEIYEKKFKMDGDKKYFKFKKIAGKYKDTSKERFPAKPSELDVKNLFYVWVSDFCDENEIRKEIKDKIMISGKRFDEAFVDLDEWGDPSGIV